jgi:hypothetical protein
MRGCGGFTGCSNSGCRRSNTNIFAYKGGYIRAIRLDTGIVTVELLGSYTKLVLDLIAFVT